MALKAQIVARIRGIVAPFFAEGDEQQSPQINPRGDLCITQSLPELTELVRLGDSWSVVGAASAPLTAVPTTTAGLSLWNGEPMGTGKCYAIDSFGTVEIVTDATQQNSLALFALNTKGAFAAPTDLAQTKGSMSGRVYGGKARTVVATVTDDGWAPHGPSAPGATAFAGGVWRVHEALVRGLYLVPPQGLFSVAAAKTVATAAQIRYFIRWHEVKVTYAT